MTFVSERFIKLTRLVIVLLACFFIYSGRGKDGSMGSLYGKFSLIDLAGMCKAIIICYIIRCSIGNC